MYTIIPTTDDEVAWAELHEHGVTFLAGCLDPVELERVRSRLGAIAAAERRDGTALLEDGSAADGAYVTGSDQPNQRVLGLVAKDPAFRSLAEHPRPLALIRRMFAEDYGLGADDSARFGLDGVLLSSITANIAGCGGRAMTPHADQGFAPPSTPYPVIVSALWMLTDFRDDTGATRIVPGSHREPAGLPGPVSSDISACAPAGTVMLYDGRLIHGTGANVSPEPRQALIATYCRPWVRSFENFALTLDAPTLSTCSPTLRALMGFEPWLVFGHSERAHAHALLDGR